MSCAERTRLLEKLVESNCALGAAGEPPAGKHDANVYNSLRVTRDRARTEAWRHLVEHRCCENLSSALIESSGGEMNLGPESKSQRLFVGVGLIV
jgi:hypothetical protein